MSDLRDIHGVTIEQFDVLKVFHFTGARRKQHFMYKWVLERDGRLYGFHLNKEPSAGLGDYLLSPTTLIGTEVIQGKMLDERKASIKRKEVK